MEGVVKASLPAGFAKEGYSGKSQEGVLGEDAGWVKPNHDKSCMITTGQSSASEVTTNLEAAPAARCPRGIEGTSLIITGHKLNGYNYLQWSSSIMMFICDKGRDDYLTNEVVIPQKNDPRKRRITW